MKQEQNETQKITLLTTTEIDSSWINVDQEWDRFRASVAQKPIAGKKFILYEPAFLRIAASWLLVAGAIAAVYFAYHNRGNVVQLMADKQVSVKTLPDGTVVTLNKKSMISYNASYNKEERQVELSGEAFFSVAPDKRQPFSVRSGSLLVKVLGTSFNMKSLAGKTEVIVETGSVKVVTTQDSVVLTAGDMITFEQDNNRLHKKPVISKLYNYYRTQTFNCKETPLKELVAALNNTFELQLTLADSSDGNIPITANFTAVPARDIVPVICATLHMSAVTEGNTIRLQRLKN